MHLDIEWVLHILDEQLWSLNLTQFPMSQPPFKPEIRSHLHPQVQISVPASIAHS